MRSARFSHGLRSSIPVAHRCAGMVTAGWVHCQRECAICAAGIAPVAPRARTQEAPGFVPVGFLRTEEDAAYRLTWMVVPPPRPMGPLSGETTLTQSASLSLKYEVSLALRSASRLLCSVPEAAVVNPASSKITHEPASISVSVRFRDGLSVATLISVPARTLPELKLYSLPLRVSTTGG